MKLDRRGWARAVHKTSTTWGFKGVKNPRLFRGGKALTPLEIVLSDDAFIEKIHEAEIKYVSECPDYADDWAEYVHDKYHTAGSCPHGTPDDKRAFEQQVTKTLKSEDARYAWACDRVDWNWVKDTIACYFHDEESVFYFLKDHPVDSVWKSYQARWVDLNDVKGYCPSCDEALDEEDRVKRVEGPHVYNDDCEEEVCRAVTACCVFDEAGNLRQVYSCANCNWLDAVDQEQSGEAPFMVRNYSLRPFVWPPRAPYPPRRSFSGYPMDVPPYEEP